MGLLVIFKKFSIVDDFKLVNNMGRPCSHLTLNNLQKC